MKKKSEKEVEFEEPEETEEEETEEEEEEEETEGEETEEEEEETEGEETEEEVPKKGKKKKRDRVAIAARAVATARKYKLPESVPCGIGKGRVKAVPVSPLTQGDRVLEKSVVYYAAVRSGKPLPNGWKYRAAVTVVLWKPEGRPAVNSVEIF